MSLRIEDTICVPTKTGEYQIQLCYGDITKVEERMDIIIVSAFPGDYSPAGGTLIGALMRNLGIRVNQLAKDKEMDLRTNFSCWMSKELDKNLPYKRLLCFERSRAKGSAIEQIREMFRMFVPACGNQETTVITPLLGTGNQGFKQTDVLTCMVETVANWMQAGLPLKCIKLVVYQDRDSNLNKLFTSLKKKVMKNIGNKSDKLEVAYDVFITYEASDKDLAAMVTKKLKSKNKDLSIYTELLKFDENKIWQDDVSKIMASSNRIVAILTPSFVSSKNCIDQFNMAMCYNRLKNSERLFPFLLASVDSMPVYMKLVQYFDCRIRKDGDVLDIKIEQACSFVLNPTSSRPLVAVDDGSEETFQYDIFISYSHKQPKQAEKMLQMLTTANSDLKIFFDRSELTMGNMWQSSLYDSLDRSECIVALVSPAYFSSVVCQEEYNIALARHLACPNEVLFIPVLIEPVETIPSHFSRICMIDGRGDKFEKVAENLTQKIIQWRLNKEEISYLQKPVDKFSFNSIENRRQQIMETKYKLDTRMKDMKPVKKIDTLTPSAKGKLDIAISFASDSVACAGTLNHIFGLNNPELQISFLNENSQGSLQDLDKAKQIVIILSKEYVKSSNHMQELHVALCRQRDAKTQRVIRIIMAENLPEKPMFVHLLPCETNLADKIWTTYQKKCDCVSDRKTVMSYKSGMKGSFMMLYRIYFALQKAAFDVMKSLSSQNKEQEIQIPPIICNILEAKLKENGYPSSIQVSECLLDIFVKNQDVKICPINENETEEIPTKEESIQAKCIPNGEHVGSVDDKNENTPKLKTKDLSDKENTGKDTSIGLTDKESDNHGNNTKQIRWAKDVGSVDDKNENTQNLKTKDLSDKEKTGKDTSIGFTDEESDNHGENTKHIRRAKETKELIESMQYMVEEESNRKPGKTSSKSKSCNLL